VKRLGPLERTAGEPAAGGLGAAVAIAHDAAFPIALVYELAIVEFERRAWIEDVIGNPDGPDLDRCLARRFGGPV
jgi:hypothetical protein